MTLLVHIEGVNFEATISDVNDLATQRGASLALLEAPKALVLAAGEKLGAETREVFTGASIGRYLLHTDKSAECVEALLRDLAAHPTDDIGEIAPVLPHLRFAVAAVDPDANGDGMKGARYRVVARAKRAQLQTPTVAVPVPADHAKLCALNPMLPATSSSKRYSASVNARREYGRQRKQKFYKSMDITLPEGDIFAREMDDLVRDAPDHVPETVRNKVALVHLDGNDFTKIREEVINDADDPLDEEAAFSKFVKKRRQHLLKRLIDDLGRCDAMFTDKEGGERVFRWETLLWGGDEATFVMPAWTLPRLLPLLSEELADDWTFKETKLTHKSGIYVADRKTPIALARRLAEALADSAKCKGKNTTQIMVSESIAPPVDVARIGANTLCEYRKRLYGEGCPAHFTLDLAQVDALIEGLRSVQAMPGGLPRSQLYGILRGLDPDKAFKRSEAKCAHVFGQPVFDASSHPLLPFQRVAELLDYFPLESS